MKGIRLVPRTLFAVFLAGGLCLCPSGCGFFENSGSVSGTVRYKGQPLSEGSVSFINDKGQVVTSPIDQSGRYALAHVPVGSVKVTVQAVSDEGPPMSFAGVPKPVPRKTQGPKVPLRYSVPATSGLQYSVTKGKQSFDLDLNE
jgi:hypothetical protein